MSPARRFFVALSADERQALQPLIHALETGEDLPGTIRTELLAAPIVVHVLVHPRYWIVYNLPDNATVEIWNIGWAWDRPPRLR